MSTNMELNFSLEIAGALAVEKSKMTNENINKFLKNSHLDMEAELVENSASEVNLCLPYYSWVTDGKPEPVGDDNLHDTSGGADYFRLSSTSDSGEWHHRNNMQFEVNVILAINHGRPDLGDHSYDGDFDYNSFDTNEKIAAYAANNPK